ncbi:MAG: GAF domain-containing sensor histidine kinase [Gemmatimonadetes bacterium]|nr:GAF domain-containing sensor histidine kinase [Gemmatimonadota bacterium]
MTRSLRPGIILRYLRRVSEAVSQADDYAEVLRAVVEGAVIDLADEAALFVVGSDTRLYRRAWARVEDGSVRSDAVVGGPLPRGSTHPAAVACEAAAMSVQSEGEELPEVVSLEPGMPASRSDRRMTAVALPLWRDGEPVGALHLALGDGRTYGSDELELLAELGHAVSLALENARLRREARDAGRAKADFLSVMSHELRTPLTAVVGYADLLEAGIPGPVNEGQQTHLQRIKENAWSLLELIDGILGYARYEGEEPDVRVEVVEPAELVEDAVGVYRSSLREKGLELEVEVPPGLPAFRTDREKAVRILLHVMSNAHKFTDAGAVHIGIDHDEDWIHFVIRDSGPGIPREDMGAIFEPFWQGQRADTRRHGGTGMGLSLARRLTELLSGRLQVDSEVGKGTTVHLSLPREGPHPTFP